jgi:hypothetical protein
MQAQKFGDFNDREDLFALRHSHGSFWEAGDRFEEATRARA